MKSWNELSMVEKADVMKLAVDGGVYDLDSIRSGYNEYAKGGKKSQSTWTMEDEAKYREWRSSLPDNLRNTDDTLYDMRGAYKAGMKPTLASDGKYHLQSRDPETGRILKSLLHPTYLQAIATDASMGYYPIVDNQGNTYTQTWEGNSFKGGGKIHIKPENRGKFTALKEKTGHSATWFKEHGTPAQRKMATFALNARHWKHEDGGNIYGDGGDFWDTLKKGIQKARNKVKEWGLDKSPMDHLVSRITTAVKDIRDNRNAELSIPVSIALNTGRIVGVNKTTKGSTNDTHYRQNLYNLIDPTDAIPESFDDVAKHVRATVKAKSNEDYPYRRVHADKAADAAWAKRLGLPYDNTVLIDNPDGSVHLADYLENEIPTDTTFLKTRIADNEKLRNRTYGPDRGKIEAALNIDKAALNSLRHTYKTGEPVEMNEFSHVNRRLLNNGETTPLNLLHRYTIQYNKGNNTMDYRDIYDFDGFEDYIPGKPFNIKGSINLNKKK